MDEDDDIDDKIRPLPTLPGTGAAAVPTEPLRAHAHHHQCLPTLAGGASQQADYSEDQETPLATQSTTAAHVVEPPTGEADAPPLAVESRDRRHYLNEAHTVRRTALAAERLAQIEGEPPVPTPTEALVVRPLVAIVPVRQPQLVESAGTADMVLALEYVSPFVADPYTHYQQGDEFAFSDTVDFADGREVSGSVPPKRLATADADDTDPTTLEAASYQHSFGLSTGRYDTVLPVASLAALVTPEERVETLVAQLAPLARVNHLQRNVITVLERVGTGVAPLFSALSTATVRTRADYDRLRERADLGWVRRRLETTLEQARALEQSSTGVVAVDAEPTGRTILSLPATATREERQRNDLPRYEALESIENSLAEHGEDRQLPNMLRVDAESGPFTLLAPVLEYEPLEPASSLLDAITYGSDAATRGSVAGDAQVEQDWVALSLGLARRRVAGLRANVPLVWGARRRAIEAQLGIGRAEKEESESEDSDIEAARLAAAYDDQEDLEVAPPRRHAAAVLERAQERANEAAAATQPATPAAATEPAPEVKRRRLRKRGGDDDESEATTVATSAKGKRGREEGEDVLAKLDEDVPEPAGLDIDEADDDENDVAIVRTLKEERLERGGITATRNTDVSLLGFLDTETYGRPMLAVPLGWSAGEALRRVSAEMRAAAPGERAGVWRRHGVWTAIVELALYAKLVPRLRDDDYFPAEARRALVDTLELIALRTSHELIYHENSLKVFRSRAKAERLRARRLVDEKNEEIAAIERKQKPVSPELQDELAELARQLDERKSTIAQLERDDADVPPALREEVRELTRALDEKRAALETVPAAMQEELLELVRHLTEIEATDSEYQSHVPAGTVPAVLAVRVAPPAQTLYLAEMVGDAPETLFSEPERQALALVYASVGQQPRGPRDVLGTRVLPLAANSEPDELYYPIAGYVDEEGAIARLFSEERAEAGLVALQQFATATGTLPRVQADPSVRTASRVGPYLEALYRELLRDNPARTAAINRALAGVVYTQLPGGNRVKPIYVVSPALASAAARAEAVRMFAVAHTESGVFSMRGVAALHKARQTDLLDAVEQDVEQHGSERTLANAAQLDANEFFSASQAVLDEAALVNVNFDLRDPAASKPVGVFATLGAQVVVNREATLAFLTSDQLLGRGRVVVSSIGVAPALPRSSGDTEFTNLHAQWRTQQRLAEELRAELAARAAPGDEMQTEEAIAASGRLTLQLVEIETRVKVLEAEMAALPANNAVLNVAPFFFFISPQTLAQVARQTIDARAQPEIAAAFRVYLDWFSSAEAAHAFRNNTATRSTFNEYRRQLLTLETALQTAVAAYGATSRYLLYEPGADVSLDAMLYAAINALAHSLAPRILALREGESRPDSMATQPFSDLAALERATTDARKDIRDRLMAIWYRVGELHGWEQLGYTTAAFNSSHPILLPRVEDALSAFDNYQLLYLALRDALRRRRGAASRRDEGDSDTEQDTEPSEAVTDLERRSGRLQLETLLRAVESETRATLAAQTLWFDLFEIGAAPDLFADVVRNALITLYAAIDSGRPLAAISLLASDARRARPNERPLSIDPRAQSIVDEYWPDFGAANSERLRILALDQVYSELYGESGAGKALEAMIDDTFYSVLEGGSAVQAPTSSTRANPATERLRRELEERTLKASREAPALRAATLAAAPLVFDPARVHAAVVAIKALEADDARYEAERAELKTREFAEFRVEQREVQRSGMLKALQQRADATARELAEAQARIRGAYRDDQARKERIGALRTAALDALERSRRGEKTVFDDPGVVYAESRIELRALLYADERAVLAEELNAEFKAVRDKMRETALRRERFALAAELGVEADRLREALRAREAQRAQVAAGLEPPQTGDAAAAEAKLAEELRGVLLLRNHLAPELLADERAAVVRAQKANEAALKVAVAGEQTAAAAATAARGTPQSSKAERKLQEQRALLAKANVENELVTKRAARIADETLQLEQPLAAALAERLETLRRRAIANHSESPATLSPSEGIAKRNGDARLAQLRRLRDALYTAAEQRERKLAYEKAPAVVPAAAAAIEQPTVDKRAEADEKLVQLIGGLLATTRDERLDSPSTRPPPKRKAKKAAASEEGDGGGGDDDEEETEDAVDQGYYDAPLANLKPLTADAALAANLLVATARPPEKTNALLLALTLQPDQFETYINWALDYLGPLLEDETRQPARPNADFAYILQSHVKRVVDESLAARIRLRFQAAQAVQDPLARVLESAVVRAVAAALPLATTVAYGLAGSKLRQIDVAALHLIADEYRAYEKSRNARALLQSLGTIELRRDAQSVAQSVPRLAAMLLLPAAIERAKLLHQTQVEAQDSPPWAVANRRDAPQAWRIAEIVARYARTGRPPLPTGVSSAITSPYVQYAEIRSAAPPTLAATGRLRYLPDRQRALHGFGVQEQRVSLGNGLHAGQPAAVDLFAAAMATQLMRVYASVQNALSSGAPTQAIDEVWRETQTSPAAVALTRAVAELPLVRSRLWCHLLMFYAPRAAPANADFPLGTRLADGSPIDMSLPVWEHMRPIDLRLLALCVLGFDYSPRTLNRDEEGGGNDDEESVRMSASYAFSRGHAAKLLLATAFYDEVIERLFATVPAVARLPVGVPLDQIDVYFAASLPVPATTPIGTLTPTLGATPQLQYVRRDAARPTATASGQMIAAQLSERQLRSAVQTQIAESWTALESRVVLDQSTLRTPPEIGFKLRALRQAGRTVVQQALTAAAVAVGPFAGQLQPRIVDHEWLLVPRAALLGALVQHAFEQSAAVAVFPGRTALPAAMRARIVGTLERILLLTDDARHMLRDDSTVSGRALMALNEQPLEALTAEPEVAPELEPELPASALPSGAAPGPIAAPTQDRPSTRVWLGHVNTAIATLLGLPFKGALWGRERKPPYAPNPWPFEPFSNAHSKARLLSTNALANGDRDALALWNDSVRPAIESVAAFFARPGAEELQLTELAPAYLSAGGLPGLGAMLTRAEWRRRTHWRHKADGSGLVRPSKVSLAVSDAVDGAYQEWHVLLLDALAVASTPKAALTAFRDRHAAEPNVGVQKFVRDLLAGNGKPNAVTIEQCVPIHETLLYYFVKSGTVADQLLLGPARYPLWPLLTAPVMQHVIVTLETTAVGDKSGMSSLHTNLVPLRKGAWRGFYPRSYASYGAEAARVAAQELAVIDLPHVVVLHEHYFASPSGAASSNVTVARFVPIGQESFYTVGEALDAAARQRLGALSIGLKMPMAGNEDAAAAEE